MRVNYDFVLKKATDLFNKAKDGDSILYAAGSYASRYDVFNDERDFDKWILCCVAETELNGIKDCSLFLDNLNDDEEDEESKMVTKTVVFDVGITVDVPEDADENDIIEAAVTQASQMSAYDLLKGTFDHIC